MKFICVIKFHSSGKNHNGFFFFSRKVNYVLEIVCQILGIFNGKKRNPKAPTALMQLVALELQDQRKKDEIIKVWKLILSGFKITADSDCSHEIKRCFLLGRKVIINLDSIFKSMNSSVLRLLHSPTFTSIHDYWKNRSLD